ncbi:MAG: hypothetical protein LBS50_11950 [Prevotellaceae bacterium]|jgi:hypothetical protein|nr:hypothetical protein [Prevotellaceae bacterium]
MKKLVYFFSVALAVSAMTLTSCNPEKPCDKNDPTSNCYDPPEETIDYPVIAPVEGKLVYVVKFEVAPCNDVIFAGSGSDVAWGWNEGTSPEERRFTKVGTIDGKDWGAEGWYKVEITIDETTLDGDGAYVISGKPVQLKEDKTFDWAYQIGYPDAASVKVKAGQGNVEVVAGYSGECDIHFISAEETVVMIFQAWKNDPCAAVEVADITFNVTVPAGLEESDVVYLAGDTQGWDASATPLTKVNETQWTVTLQQAEVRGGYKYLLNGDWEQEELAVIEEGANCAIKIDNRPLTQTTNNDVVANFRGRTATKCDDPVTE